MSSSASPAPSRRKTLLSLGVLALLTDMQCRVMDISTSKPIPGLFAAGEATSGVHGAVRLGSCAILDCLVNGRIAGQEAAKA